MEEKQNGHLTARPAIWSGARKRLPQERQATEMGMAVAFRELGLLFFPRSKFAIESLGCEVVD
jgi:hypothetical protein